MPEKIWTYYDATGNRVRKRRAVFAGKEVLVTAGVPTRFDRASMPKVEYRDVYLVTMPDDRRQFKSERLMLQWFHKVAAASAPPSTSSAVRASRRTADYPRAADAGGRSR